MHLVVLHALRTCINGFMWPTSSMSNSPNGEFVSSQPVNLLWTSGWDSTFRLLELVVVARRPVQPYYVYDRARGSSDIELRTQRTIRDAITAAYPESAALIAETRVIDGSDIPADDSITGAFGHLVRKSYIGFQYDYLSRLAHAEDIEALELSVHKDDKIFRHLDGNIEQEESGTYRISDGASADVDFLRRFRFPILDLTKKDMERQATQAGFAEILELTWFCHYPVRSKPCGRCNPCRYTMEEGLGRRLPWTRRLRAQIVKPLSPLKRYILDRLQPQGT